MVTIQSKVMKHELTDSQVFLMQMLSYHGPMRCSDLAEELHITMPAVTNLTNKLVQKGFIERAVSEHDRRSILLSITTGGATVLSQVNEQHARLMDIVWSGFTEEELNQLLLSCRKLEIQLNRISNGA